MHDVAQPAISATDLGKRFGPTWALAHVDLKVPRGVAVWLKGPNGAGKTTLLRIAATLGEPSRGSLEVLGLDCVRDRDRLRRRISLISHSLYLYPGLTAAETLRLWHRLGADEAEPSRIVEALEGVGLGTAADRRVAGFSAGMRKRLALARTWIERPELLLLDEPFSALDEDGCRLVQKQVRKMVESGGTVLLASHDPDRAQPVCDLTIELREGQVAAIERSAPGAGGRA